jgi:hypothetical protein
LGERPLPIIWKIIMHWISMLTLDDHVVHDHTSTHDLPLLSHRSLQNGVADNRKTLLSTPNTRSTSFRWRTTMRGVANT